MVLRLRRNLFEGPRLLTPAETSCMNRVDRIGIVRAEREVHPQFDDDGTAVVVGIVRRAE